MSAVGYILKKPSSEIESSPWGVQYLARDYPHDLLLDHLGASGAKWVRLSTGWRGVEVEKGRYRWDLLDRLVDGLLCLAEPHRDDRRGLDARPRERRDHKS